jgi:hypothetical protein
VRIEKDGYYHIKERSCIVCDHSNFYDSLGTFKVPEKPIVITPQMYPPLLTELRFEMSFDLASSLYFASNEALKIHDADEDLRVLEAVLIEQINFMVEKYVTNDYEYLSNDMIKNIQYVGTLINPTKFVKRAETKRRHGFIPL